MRFFYRGSFDAATLLHLLKQAPGLADYADELGNMQSAVRLDYDDDGIWVTVPDGTDQAVVDAAVAGYTPPVPKPTAPDAVLAAIESVNPETATVKDVLTVIQAALVAAGAHP